MTEAELINFGILNGWLKSIARVNDKTNNGHDFKIIKYPKIISIKEFCDKTFNNIAEEIEISEELTFESLLIDKFKFWFYQYQPNLSLKGHFLEDKHGDFSLYDSQWKDEWVEEFVNLLVLTLKPKSVYTVYTVNLRCIKNYYCNMSDDIILVGDNNYFQIHCCLTD